MVIGITGKSCSGKNIAADILEQEAGFFQIDADLISHQVLEEKKSLVETTFNIHLSYIHGKMDRRELAGIVFSSPEELRKLEEILYPEINRKILKLIEEHEKVTINGAKLMESGLHLLCHSVLWIEAPYIIRLKRGKKRDLLSNSQLTRRFYAQKKLSAQPWKKSVDIYRVGNFGRFSTFKNKLLKILYKIT